MFLFNECISPCYIRQIPCPHIKNQDKLKLNLPMFLSCKLVTNNTIQLKIQYKIVCGG